jgi:Fusaric acid resistance protein-like
MISAEERSSPTTTPQPSGLGQAVIRGVLLAACCLVSYAVITYILVAARIVSRDDELLGGMWAVIATIFVFRFTYQESVTAALSRMSATALSFALCFLYLLLFPFRPLGLAALIGIGAILLSLIGRSGDIITAGITTAVVMVAAGISPQHAWKEPIFRLIDTVIGIGVGIAGAWMGRALTRHSPSREPAELREAPPSKL